MGKKDVEKSQSEIERANTLRLLRKDPDYISTRKMFKDVEKKINADPKLVMEMAAMRDDARLGAMFHYKFVDLRRGANLTQAELARRLGCTQRKVVRMERDGYLGTLRDIAEFARACGKRVIIYFR
jgi:DNA-binding XRE family transcriptional regulator